MNPIGPNFVRTIHHGNNPPQSSAQMNASHSQLTASNAMIHPMSLPDRTIVGPHVLHVGALQTPLPLDFKPLLEAALSPSARPLILSSLQPDINGMISFEADAPLHPGFNSNERMLVTVQIDQQNSLRGLSAAKTRFNVDHQMIAYLPTHILTVTFAPHSATVATASPSSSEGSYFIDYPLDTSLRPGDSVNLDGHDYEVKETSVNGFTVGLADVGAKQRYQQTLNANPIDVLSPEIKQDAKQRLDAAQKNLLSEHPDKFAELAGKTQLMVEQYIDGNDAIRDNLTDSLRQYQAADGDHVMMNIALLGHKSWADYLREAAPDEYQSNENINENIDDFCRDFIGFYNYFEMDTDELHDRFQELIGSAEQVKNFVSNGVNLNDMSLVKGVKSGHSSGIDSTAVDMKKYVMAFLNGEKIHYNSFLSTSANWEVSSGFSGNPSANLVANMAVDLDDHSPEGAAKHTTLLRELANDATRDNNAFLMLILDCKDAKGVMLTGSALDMPATIQADETEIMLALDHIITPKQVIRTEDGYVLRGEVTHQPMANNDTENR